jgi:ketosteroid isomerase-like protein
MPHEYKDTAALLYQALARRDHEAFLALFDPRGELWAAENFIYAGGNPYIGPDAIRDGVLSRLNAEWDGFLTSAEEILGAGDVVIVRGRYRGTFKATGTKIEAEFVHVINFKDDKVMRFQTYTDTAQFRDAVQEARTSAS